MTRVFVYGSLKREFPLHAALADQQFVGNARTVIGFRMYNVGTFPAMVEDGDGIAIRGELYEVDDVALRRLDRIEGEGSLYERVEIELYGGGLADAYLYLSSTDGMDDVGDFWN